MILSLLFAAVLNVACTADVNCAPAIQKVIDTAKSGDQVLLPSGRWLVDSAILVNKSVHVHGRQRTTTLFHRSNVGLGGSGGLIQIDADNVSLAHFTIAAEKPLMTTRTPAIRIRGNNSNIAIVDMGFENITSTCVLAVGRSIFNVAVIGSFANEYYEQFVELAAAGSGFRIAGNYAKSTRGHPNLGSTEPFPVAFTPGLGGGGLLENVDVIGNVFDHGRMGVEAVNTVAVRLSDDKWQTVPFAFDDIRIIGNSFSGQGRGVQVRRLQNLGMGSSGLVEIRGNTFARHTSEPINIATSGSTAGRVTIADNHIYKRESWAPYLLQQGPNVVVTKTGNFCFPHVNKLAASACN